MKILMMLVLSLFSATSFAGGSSVDEPTVLTGQIVGGGGACTLTVDSWGFKEGEEQGWWSMTMTVRTSFQLEGNPAITVTASPTPWALYGKVKATYDQIAVNLRTSGELNLEAVQSYQFQTWDEKRGLLQKSCRFY